MAGSLEVEAFLRRRRSHAEKIKAGQLRAVERGAILGRPPILDLELVKSMRKAGKTYRQIAKALNCSLSAAHKAGKSFLVKPFVAALDQDRQDWLIRVANEKNRTVPDVLSAMIDAAREGRVFYLGRLYNSFDMMVEKEAQERTAGLSALGGKLKQFREAKRASARESAERLQRPENFEWPEHAIPRHGDDGAEAVPRRPSVPVSDS